MSGYPNIHNFRSVPPCFDFGIIFPDDIDDEISLIDWEDNNIEVYHDEVRFGKKMVVNTHINLYMLRHYACI